MTTKESFEKDLQDRPYLPDCWLDDKRMEVLFAPFRVRETNPEGWDLKMLFWINAINKWCLQKRIIIFKIDDIRTAFQRGDQKPSIECLKLVLSQMKREEKLLFENELPSRNKKTIAKKALDWTVNSLVFKPFSLVSNLMNREDSHPHEKILPDLNLENTFYNKNSIDLLLDSVLKWIQTLKTSCVKYDAFHEMINNQLFSNEPLSSSTLDVIIELLEHKNILKTAAESGIRIVKYGKDCQIKETDVSIVKLDVCKEIIQKECSKLEDEMEKLQKDARQALENKNRDKAMLILKKKKRIEAKLIEKDTQIFNIETLHQQIVDSDSHQAILDAFQVANSVLKKTTNKIEEFETTITQVEETLDDISALNSELNRPLAESTAFTNEAEEELDEILKDIENEKLEKAQKEKQEKEEKEAILLQNLTDLTIIDSDDDNSLLAVSPTKNNPDSEKTSTKQLLEDC